MGEGILDLQSSMVQKSLFKYMPIDNRQTWTQDTAKQTGQNATRW